MQAFLESLLGESPYFGSNCLTLGDIVAGASVSWFPRLDISLDEHPKLKAWFDRVRSRYSWIETEPSPEAIEAFKSRMKSK